MLRKNQAYAYLNGEKEQTNTLVGVIYMLIIATTLGTVFYSSANYIGEGVKDRIEDTFRKVPEE